MKPFSVFVFLILTIVGLGFIGWFFPKDGVNIAGKNLLFISPYDLIKSDSVAKAQLKIKEQTIKLNQLKLQTKSDSLKVLREFSTTSASRIFYPNNDSSYFHALFQALDSSKNYDKIVRIIHYGDSQLEMDRISDMLRSQLQEIFGGYGTGILPAIQPIPTRTVNQFASGGLTRNSINDSTRTGLGHRRFGLMGSVCTLNGSAQINFKTTKTTFENTQNYNKIRVLYKNNAGTFNVKLQQKDKIVFSEKNDSVSKFPQVMQIKLDSLSNKGTLILSGNADIYGFSLEGNRGVVVDNVPLRGSSGDFFTQLDSISYTDGLRLMDTRLIILQYGGNAMPAITNQKKVDFYASLMDKQIKFFIKAFPKSKILYIGPSDASKKVKGQFQTLPFLPELNTALKNTALSNGIAYWDLYQTMGGNGSMIEWVKAKPSLANSDYIHFSQKGANLVGEMLFTAFYNDYQIYKLTHQVATLKKKL